MHLKWMPYSDIVKVASYTDRKDFGLLMSPVADCNLTEYLRSAERHPSHQRTLSTFFGCLAAAVSYLHQIQIRHRDIKPDNILVKGGQVYLTDFGISLDWEHLSKSTTTEESGRTLAYCAPEVAEQFQKRNSSTDVWSLGCVFTEMLVVRHGLGVEQLKTAFRNNSDSRTFYQNSPVVNEWFDKKLQEPRPVGTGRSLSQLTLAMLSRDSKERPTAHAVYHIISGFQLRDAKYGNPYCGECCMAEAQAVSDTSSVDLTTREDSITTITSALHDTRGRSGTSSPERQILHPSPVPARSLQDVQKVREQSLEEASNASLVLPIRQEPHGHPANAATYDASNFGDLKHRKRRSSVLSILKSKPEQVEDQMESSGANTSGQIAIDSSSKVTDTTTNFRNPKYLWLLESLPFERWPIVDLEGNLPYLSSRDWTSPDVLGSAVQRDSRFMGFLWSTQPDLHARVMQRQGYHCLPLIHLLLYNGLDLNKMWQATFQEDCTTPMMAIIIDDISIVDEYNADKGYTSWSACGIRLSMIRLLAAYGGFHKEWHSRRIIDASRARHIGLVDYMYSIGPLAMALKMQDMELFEALLDAGADPNEPCYEGLAYHVRNVFMLASECGNLHVVKTLDKVGASIKGVLRLAAEKGHEDVLSYLLHTGKYTSQIEESRGYLSPRGKFVGTPLYLAAKFGHAGAVKILFYNGANARAFVQMDGNIEFPTEPLNIAAISYQIEVVKFLVEEAGVHPDAHPLGGKRALTCISDTKSYLAGYLLKKGAKPRTIREKFADKIKS